jgi:ABC-type nitrate/sulfonate/bicarbonate transport system permease component
MGKAKKTSKKVVPLKKAKELIHEIKVSEEKEYGTKELIHGILIGLLIGLILGILIFKGKM